MKILFLLVFSFILLFASTLSKKEKEQILKTIETKNIYINNIKRYKNTIIATGEDDNLTCTAADDEHYSIILKSSNNGLTWNRIRQGDEIVPRKILILNHKYFIIGSGTEGFGNILITKDAGETWLETYDGEEIEVLKKTKDFIEARTYSFLLKSYDKGKTWTKSSLE